MDCWAGFAWFTYYAKRIKEAVVLIILPLWVVLESIATILQFKPNKMMCAN